MRLSEWMDASWLGRVVIGEPRALTEYAASIGLDLVVFGDVRDLTKETYLFIIRDPDANTLVGSFALVGILTTPTGAGDAFVSLAKNLFKTTSQIAKVSPEFSTLFVSAGKSAVMRAHLADVKALGKLASELLARDLNRFRGVVTSSGDLLDLARHVAVYGSRVLDFVERHGREGFTFLVKMVGRSKEVSVRLPKDQLLHAWEHWKEWQEIGIGSVRELEVVLWRTTISGKKFVYRQFRQGALRNQFGFYDEAHNVFIALTEDGELITAFRPDQGWDYVRNLTMFFEMR